MLGGAGHEVVEVVSGEVQPELRELLSEGDGRHDSPSFFESES